MSHVPQTLAVIALDLVSISSASSLSHILIVSGHGILVTTLPVGPLAHIVGILIVSSLTLI